MSYESDLVALLQTQCPRVYPDVAPADTALPFVTWQTLGGASISFADNTAIDKRNTLLQINTWATTRLGALTLIRAIENALRSASFVATPEGESIFRYEEETDLYGCIQRFDVWSER